MFNVCKTALITTPDPGVKETGQQTPEAVPFLKRLLSTAILAD